jgi:hypothetical protein
VVDGHDHGVVGADGGCLGDQREGSQREPAGNEGGDGLAHVLKYLTAVEAFGTDMNSILSSWREKGLRPGLKPLSPEDLRPKAEVLG